ncbi:MAG: type II secretion system protein [Deltaproteobacteria bacterium]
MGSKMNRGFTLIEMIITIVVLGILGVFTFAFFGNYVSTYTQMRDRRNLHQEAVYIIERISRELRDATTATSTSHSISFTIPSPGTPADTSTTITYTLSGTQLTRTGNISGAILMGNSMDSTNGLTVSTPVTNCYRITVQRGTESYTTAVCPKNIPSASSGFGGNYADVF